MRKSVIKATVLLGTVVCGMAAGDPIRIMPLGDSLTRGLNGVGNVPGGYRTHLYNRLVTEDAWYQANGVDLVGTASDNPDPFPPVAPDTDWLPDPNHEGHGGQRIDQAQSGILDWLAATNPAIVLMHLGTNDVAQDYLLGTAPDRLDTLIDTIATNYPDTHVIAAQIIISTSGTENTQIEAFNAELPAIVAGHQAAGHNVTLVDMYSAITPANMVDAYHPGKAGYDQMADAWFTAVQALGDVSNPADPPPPPPSPGDTIVQTTDLAGPSQTAFPAATGDLIDSSQSTLAGAVHTGYTPYTGDDTTSTAALNDGILGQDSSNSNTAFDLDGVWTSTFELDLAAAPGGYDITEIRALSGWPGSRRNQRFELLISTVAQPADFVSYGTFEYLGGGDGSAQITLTGEAGAIASSVAAVRFGILSPGSGAETVYREIDVFGTPTVIPEPATAILGALGGAMLLRRRPRAPASA